MASTHFNISKSSEEQTRLMSVAPGNESFCLDDVILEKDLSWISDPERIRSLETDGFVIKSSIASNEILPVPSDDISNDSLAISSEGNTATEESRVKSGSIDIGVGAEGTEHHTDHLVRPASGGRKHQDNLRLHEEHLCRSCRKSVLRDCVCPDRERHVRDNLHVSAESMRHELSLMSLQADGAIERIGRAIQTVSSAQTDQDTVSHQLELAEEDIKATADLMIQRIRDETNDILREVARLRKATDIEQLKSLQQIMQGRRDFITKIKSKVVATNTNDVIVDVYRKMRESTWKALNICAEGGAIDRIQDLSIKVERHVPAGQRVGRLVEETGWKLCEEIDIPFVKREEMQGMTSLPGARLAVGYKTGGVDIFSYGAPGARHPKRILGKMDILDIVSTPSGNIIICPVYGDIGEFDTDGTELGQKFDAPTSNDHVSLSRTTDGRVFMAYPERDKIFQFQGDGGAVLKTIPTEGKYKPVQIDLTVSGKIIVKDKEGIRIVDEASQESIAFIKVGKGQFAYATCDTKDNIYVAKVTGRRGTASINMHNTSGDIVENVTDDLRVSTCGHARFWLRLVSISPSLLAVCDGTCISIYRKMPSVVDLADDMEKL